MKTQQGKTKPVVRLCANCNQRPRYGKSGWCLECHVERTNDIRVNRTKALDLINQTINALEGSNQRRTPEEIAEYVRIKLLEKGINFVPTAGQGTTEGERANTPRRNPKRSSASATDSNSGKRELRNYGTATKGSGKQARNGTKARKTDPRRDNGRKK